MKMTNQNKNKQLLVTVTYQDKMSVVQKMKLFTVLYSEPNIAVWNWKALLSYHDIFQMRLSSQTPTLDSLSEVKDDKHSDLA